MPELSGAPGVWVLTRYVVNQLTLVGSNGINAAGDALIYLGTVPAGLYYEVERITTDTSPGGVSFTMYAVDNNSNINIREHALVTADPILVFDESSLVRFFPNEQIFVTVNATVSAYYPTVTLQVQVIMWKPTFVPDEIGPGTVITQGLEHGPDSNSPDPGGWN
jgi:hypothetical protein